MTERSTQTELVCVWDNYETLQPARSLGTSPVRCCSEETHRKRSRSSSRGSKRKQFPSDKRDSLMRPFGISDEEYNGSFHSGKDSGAYSARSYTPEDRASWAPISLNTPKNQERCYIAEKKIPHFSIVFEKSLISFHRMHNFYEYFAGTAKVSVSPYVV